MQFDFPTILFLAALLTGLIWALDVFFWSKKRKAAAGEEQVKEPLVVEYSRAFFPIIVIVLVLRSFLVEPFRIPSNSMMPTLLTGDFILVNKFSYGIRLPVINKKIIDIGSPERGDVVVFRYPEDPSIDYIKRVIGLPGDEIRYINKVLTINGKPLMYKDGGIYFGRGSGSPMTGALKRTEKIDDIEHDILIAPGGLEHLYACMQGNTYFKVPEGHYFVMGDNRDRSNDSRFWCAVPDQNLVGKAFMIWMHWDSGGEGLELSRIGDKIK